MNVRVILALRLRTYSLNEPAAGVRTHEGCHALRKIGAKLTHARLSEQVQ